MRIATGPPRPLTAYGWAVRHPVLLLTRPAQQFILGEHATDLAARGGGTIALPARVPYGAVTRAPRPLRPLVARRIARDLMRQVPGSVPAAERVAIAYHAVQWPVIEQLLRSGAVGAAWYCRWDRYEAALDAGPRAQLLGDWHEQLAAASELIFCVSGRLAELEEEQGRTALTLPTSADAFPEGLRTPDAAGAELLAASGGAPAADAPVAVSLGHLGRRTDWAWLRGACDALPALTLLLIGDWHEDEVGSVADFRWLRASPQVRWLGRLSDADAASVIAQADVGLVPFLTDPFNDAGLPNRILKYARLGRRTLSPPLAGVRTWSRAVDIVDGVPELAAALAAAQGRRTAPSAELHAWALTQTVERMNDPLLARLAEGATR